MDLKDINWNITSQELINETNNLIKKSTIINNDLAKYSFTKQNLKDFLNKLADDISEVEFFHSFCGFIQFISPEPKTRKASMLADLMLSKYVNELNMRNDLYEKITEFLKIAEKENIIDDSDKRFLNKLISTYQRNGITLDSHKRQELLKIRQEITNLENSIIKYYSLNENKQYSFKEEELNGLPDYFFKNINKNDIDNKTYMISLNKLNYNSMMKYIEKDYVRKKIEVLYSDKFKDSIEPIINGVILKDKHAKLLSYASHSDYKAHNQMIKSSDNIKNFLTDLIERLDYRYKKEIDSISSSNNCKVINSYDIPFFLNKWKIEYGVNDNTIREYFEYNNTIKMIIKIYESLFNIKFKIINSVENIWHCDVIIYKIQDLNNNSTTNIGILYLDLLSREGKYKQTRCFCLRSGCYYPCNKERFQTPIASIVASLGSNNNVENKLKSLLLTHQEVISIFHEFGHAMHHIFGKTKYIIFSGTKVELDFIETPAQVLDLLCWEKNTLKLLSCHFQTKKQLPDEIINKLIKIKNLDVGLHYKKHILLSLFDQMVYSSESFINLCNKTNQKEELAYLLTNLYKKIFNETMISNCKTDKYKINLNSNLILPVEWLQTLCGNDAQYYCYTWSRVLSADIFNEKFKGKPIDKKIGEEFRKNILNYGGSKDSYKIVCDYLKRKPEINGFLNMFDLDTDAEYSFFLASDKINSTTHKTCNNNSLTTKKGVNFNIIKESKYKKDSEEDCIESISNKFSEINESSIDGSMYMVKGGDLNDITEDN